MAELPETMSLPLSLSARPVGPSAVDADTPPDSPKSSEAASKDTNNNVNVDDCPAAISLGEEVSQLIKIATTASSSTFSDALSSQDTMSMLSPPHPANRAPALFSLDPGSLSPSATTTSEIVNVQSAVFSRDAKTQPGTSGSDPFPGNLYWNSNPFAVHTQSRASTWYPGAVTLSEECFAPQKSHLEIDEGGKVSVHFESESKELLETQNSYLQKAVAATQQHWVTANEDMLDGREEIIRLRRRLHAIKEETKEWKRKTFLLANEVRKRLEEEQEQKELERQKQRVVDSLQKERCRLRKRILEVESTIEEHDSEILELSCKGAPTEDLEEFMKDLEGSREVIRQKTGLLKALQERRGEIRNAFGGVNDRLNAAIAEMQEAKMLLDMNGGGRGDVQDALQAPRVEEGATPGQDGE